LDCSKTNDQKIHHEDTKVTKKSIQEADSFLVTISKWNPAFAGMTDLFQAFLGIQWRIIGLKNEAGHGASFLFHCALFVFFVPSWWIF